MGTCANFAAPPEFLILTVDCLSLLPSPGEIWALEVIHIFELLSCCLESVLHPGWPAEVWSWIKVHASQFCPQTCVMCFLHPLHESSYNLFIFNNNLRWYEEPVLIAATDEYIQDSSLWTYFLEDAFRKYVWVYFSVHNFNCASNWILKVR